MNNKKNTRDGRVIGIIRKFREMEKSIDELFEVTNTILNEKNISKKDSQKIKESMQCFLDSMFDKSPNLLLESYFRNSERNFIGKDTE